MNTSRITPAQLLALTVAPVAQAIERAALHVRLRHSRMAVDVLERQLQNDRTALSYVHGTANPAETRATLRQQIAQTHDDIASEHQRQAVISSRLALLRNGTRFH